MRLGDGTIMPSDTLRRLSIATAVVLVAACGPASSELEEFDAEWLVGEYYWPVCDTTPCTTTETKMYNINFSENRTYEDVTVQCFGGHTLPGEWEPVDANTVRLLPSSGNVSALFFNARAVEFRRTDNCDELAWWMDPLDDDTEPREGIVRRGTVCIIGGEKCIENTIDWCDAPPESCD